MIAWLVAFLFTEIIEVPIYLVALRRTLRPAPRFAVAFGASLLTHPIVWFVFPRLLRPYVPMVLAAEAFAIGAEALYLAAFGLRGGRALAWSLAANGTSVLLGFACRAVYGWP